MKAQNISNILLNEHVQQFNLPKTWTFLSPLYLPVWYRFNKGTQYRIMALTHLLYICLNGTLHERTKSPYNFMHLVCSIRLSYAHYIIPAYDLCLGLILLLFSTEAGAASLSLHQHLQSICENRQLSIALEETEWQYRTGSFREETTAPT